MSTRTWSPWAAAAGQRNDVVSLTADLLAHAARRFKAWGPSAEDTDARDAARVREMARRLQASDPGFASDLFAAADRHDAAAESRR